MRVTIRSQFLVLSMCFVASASLFSSLSSAQETQVAHAPLSYGVVRDVQKLMRKSTSQPAATTPADQRGQELRDIIENRQAVQSLQERLGILKAQVARISLDAREIGHAEATLQEIFAFLPNENRAFAQLLPVEPSMSVRAFVLTLRQAIGDAAALTFENPRLRIKFLSLLTETFERHAGLAENPRYFDVFNGWTSKIWEWRYMVNDRRTYRTTRENMQAFVDGLSPAEKALYARFDAAYDAAVAVPKKGRSDYAFGPNRRPAPALANPRACRNIFLPSFE